MINKLLATIVVAFTISATVAAAPAGDTKPSATTLSLTEKEATELFFTLVKKVRDTLADGNELDPAGYCLLPGVCASCGISGPGDRKPGAPFCSGHIGTISCHGVCDFSGCLGGC